MSTTSPEGPEVRVRIVFDAEAFAASLGRAGDVLRDAAKQVERPQPVESDPDRLERLWRSPLGRDVSEVRRLLDDLGAGTVDFVRVRPELLRRTSTLLADALEGGPRA